jgi:hypothetical protein
MHDDTLMAFAQIAATFVGFAALVSALNRDRLGDTALLTVARLWLVVVASLVVMFGAITPVTLVHYQLTEPTVWRISSVVVLFANLVAFLAVNHWHSRVDFSRERFANVVFSVLALFTVAPLVLMVFGALPVYATGFFFTFMAFALAQAAFAFVLLLDALLWREFIE